jgi:hypothetical protein
MDQQQRLGIDPCPQAIIIIIAATGRPGLQPIAASSAVSGMLVARHGLAAALLADRLHVMGGGFQSHGMPDEVIDLGTQ